VAYLGGVNTVEYGARMVKNKKVTSVTQK